MSIYVRVRSHREVCDECGKMADGAVVQMKIVHDSLFAGAEDCPGHAVTVCHFCLPEVIGKLIRSEEHMPLRSVSGVHLKSKG